MFSFLQLGLFGGNCLDIKATFYTAYQFTNYITLSPMHCSRTIVKLWFDTKIVLFTSIAEIQCLIPIF